MICFICKLNLDNISIWNYIKHIESHPSDIKQYICTICFCSYSQNTSFYNHLVKHLNGKNFIEPFVIVVPNENNIEITQEMEENPTEQINNLINIEDNSNHRPITTLVEKMNLKRIFLNILLKYLHKSACPRSLCFDFFNDFCLVFKNVLSEILKVDDFLGTESLKTFFYLFENDLYKISEHKLFSELTKMNIIVPYNKQNLGIMQALVTTNSGTNIKNDERFFYTFNLVSLFTILFSNLSFTNEIFGYIDFLFSQNDLICNVMQTDFWREKIDSLNPEKDKTVAFLPISFYYDDVEALNALGVHAGAYTIGDVFIRLLCLPPKLAAKLDLIFPVQFNFSNDRKEYGNMKLFKHIIEQINYISREGIPFNYKEFKTLKLVLVMVHGDNKGTHEILDFVCNFSTTAYFCRICKLHKDELKKVVLENFEKLRTPDNYEIDSVLCNAPLTGIKKPSVFNHVFSFNVIDNLSIDPMHDLLEGAANYALANILLHFIKQKFFTLDQLNIRLRNFDYGPVHSNLPDNIKKEMLDRRKLRFTASEMQTFIFNFNLLIGPWITDKTCKHWQLYLLFREITILVCSDIVTKNSHFNLISLVEGHNTLYVELFGETLKYKQHLLIHYGKVMQKFGPLSQFSTIRSEGKHKVFTSTLKNSSCKKNILKTVATKAQLQYAYLFNCYDFSTNIEIGPQSDIYDINLLEDFGVNYVARGCDLKFIKTLGKIFKPNVVFERPTNEIFPDFGVVSRIFISNSVIYILFERLETISYKSLLDVYLVEKTNSFEIIELNDIDLQERNSHLTYIFKMNNNKLYVNYIKVK